MKAYGVVLGIPGARAASLAALIARLPLSMAGLSIVLLVSETDGSYRRAGALAGAYILAAAIGGPAQGRLSDRVGQRLVLCTAGTLFATGLVTFTIALTDETTVLLAAGVVLAGLGAPQAGSFMRARWVGLLRGRPELLQTAYAFEAVVDEVVFICGPILVTVIATTFGGAVGVQVTAVLGLAGAVTLAAQGATAPAPAPRAEGPRPPLGLVFVGTIVAVGVGLGTLFGATEVLVVAFADERQARHLAGLVLAAWACGSLIAGLLVGATRAPRSQERRLQMALSGLALAFLPLPFVDDVVVLAVLLFLGGFLIAPSLIAAVTLIQQNVPAQRLTEGIAWSTTGMAVGIAPGAALSGRVVDAYGAAAGFVVPMVAGALAALAAWVVVPGAVRRLRARDAGR